MVLGCSAASYVRKEGKQKRITEAPSPYANILSRAVVPRPFGRGLARGSRRNEETSRVIKVERRPYNPASWQMLAAAIKTDEMLTNAHVSSLDLVDCGLVGDDHGVEKFCAALQANVTLKELLLSGNNLGADPSRTSTDEKFVVQLSRSLMVNCSLTRLMLNDNMLKDAGAEALATALRSNNTLKVLGLRGNAISSAGCKAIGDALKFNESIEELDLSHNMLGSYGAQLLCGALCCSSSIQWLDISDCTIGDDGTAAVARLLERTLTLADLDISYNQISDASTIGTALRANTSLTRLDLHTNTLGATQESVAELAAGIQFNVSLQILDLSDIGMEPDTAATVVAGLTQSKSILEANLSYNVIGPSVGNSLAQALQVAKSPIMLLCMEHCGLGFHATKNLESVAPEGLQLQLGCNYGANDGAETTSKPEHEVSK